MNEPVSNQEIYAIMRASNFARDTFARAEGMGIDRFHTIHSFFSEGVAYITRLEHERAREVASRIIAGLMGAEPAIAMDDAPKVSNVVTLRPDQAIA